MAIKTLSGIDHIQHRAEMYIGDTTYSTHLTREIISNAEDECLAGRCNKINIFLVNDINNNQWSVVQDFGSGIPLTSPDLPNKDIPIEICCSTNTGGKFNNGEENSSYIVSAGSNGLGLKAVNALSTYLYLTTKANDKDDNYWEYFFKEGKFISKKLINLKENIANPEDLYSTEIKFLPSPKYFQNPYAVQDIIRNELEIAKYGLGNNTIITFNGENIENKYYDEFIGTNSVEVINDFGLSSDSKESCNITISLYDDFDSGKVFKGIVNLLSSNEGTHMNICNNLLKNKLMEIATKNKKLIQPNDILVPIKILCNLRLKEPRFDSQTKVKLAVRPNILQPLIEPIIDKLIKNNKEFFIKVIDKAEEYRVNLETSKSSRKSKSGRYMKVNGLKDCNCRKSELCTLYIVEGDSAGGNMSKCRNPEYDAVLGLRGKILNVIADKSTKFKILENQVINCIANALGYKLYGDIDPEKCRYGKIMITTDADFDGAHIACLLINIFYTFFIELIKDGRVYIITCPLYGTTINKKFVPIFTKEDCKRYEGYDISYYKGLSEMNADQLYEAAINPSSRRCLQLQYEDFDIKDLWENKLGNLKQESISF